MNPSLANSMKMAELRLVQLQQEVFSWQLFCLFVIRDCLKALTISMYLYQVDHWRNLAQEKEKMLKENKKCFHPPPPASFSPLQVNDGIETVVAHSSLSGYQSEQGGGKSVHQKTAGGE